MTSGLRFLAIVGAASLLFSACGSTSSSSAIRPAAGQSPGPRFDPIQDDEIQDILPQDAIQAIDSPTYLSAAAVTDMHDADEILGVAINGQARAFPLATLSVHEIVNDTIGGQPVAVSW